MTHQHMDIRQYILKLLFASLKLILCGMTALKYTELVGSKRACYVFIHALASLFEISWLQLELCQVFKNCWILWGIAALVLLWALKVNAILFKTSSVYHVVLMPKRGFPAFLIEFFLFYLLGGERFFWALYSMRLTNRVLLGSESTEVLISLAMACWDALEAGKLTIKRLSVAEAPPLRTYWLINDKAATSRRLWERRLILSRRCLWATSLSTISCHVQSCWSII